MHVHDFLNRVRKATIEMTDKNGKLPTDEELAKHLEVTVVRIQVCARVRRRHCLDFLFESVSFGGQCVVLCCV